MKNRWGLLVLVVITAIFYLTFQTPSETMALSNGFRAWLAERFGIELNSHAARSGAHIPLYFALGLSLCLWAGWKNALRLGPLIGLTDELIKILLPTRHFDLEDLIIDIVSVAAGAFAVVMFRRIRDRLLKRSP